ncbi:LysR family transcriptional regulator [Ferrimonas sp. YFM]|uniref:LysR family transcriptional regulator n=1 Tax=Ferrimonas sp. YFM TaxID=3028878 RepID=UPI002572F6A4|nr:LysR family transcriptional regulator [Ferrimonas sp. YFM]BDY04227.1 LysR family transcriptional regulator [Ferrimonas sp. YFM]
MSDCLTWRRLRRLSLFDLEVFLLLSQKLNSNQVAESLGILPSKVSRTLSGLREVFDDPLFVRRQHGFEPTAVAVGLYPQVDALLEVARAIPGRRSAQQAEGKRPQIRVAVPTIFAPGLLHFLKSRAESKGQELDVAVVPGVNGPGRVGEGQQIDLAVYCAFSPWKEGDSKRICQSIHTRVVAVRDHPIWDRISELHLALLDYPFVVTEVPNFNEGRDPIEDYALSLGRTLEVEARVASLPDLVNVLSEGKAYSFIGGYSCKEYLESHPDLVTSRLPYSFLQQVRRLFHGPSAELGVYLYRNEAANCPEWLEAALCEFVSQNVGR